MIEFLVLILIALIVTTIVFALQPQLIAKSFKNLNRFNFLVAGFSVIFILLNIIFTTINFTNNGASDYLKDLKSENQQLIDDNDKLSNKISLKQEKQKKIEKKYNAVKNDASQINKNISKYSKKIEELEDKKSELLGKNIEAYQENPDSRFTTKDRMYRALSVVENKTVNFGYNSKISKEDPIGSLTGNNKRYGFIDLNKIMVVIDSPDKDHFNHVYVVDLPAKKIINQKSFNNKTDWGE